MKESFKSYFIKFAGIGAGISFGFLASALLAVAVSGTINTFASGDQLDASKVNENFTSLRNAIVSIPDHDSVRVKNSSSQTVLNASDKALTFDTEEFDLQDMHNNTVNSSRLTAKATGLYLIIGNAIYESNTSGVRTWRLKVNNTQFIAGSVLPASTTSNATEITITSIYRLEQGDYVELIARQDSGSTLNIINSATFGATFAMVKVSN